MTIYVWDKDRQQVVERGDYAPPSSGVTIIKDIEPYRAVAADVDGKAPVIGSRSEHRRFLKRNGYIEIGNEKTGFKPKEYHAMGDDVRRAIYEVKNR